MSSLAVKARRISDAARIRWLIENALHWLLGVVFREDDSRLREGLAAENLALAK